MISNFKYLSPISEAYEQMNEAWSKGVQKLLLTDYAPVYKEDGYDQFGVNKNGRKRDGKIAPWRFSDQWLGDESRLAKVLSDAKKAEDRFLNKLHPKKKEDTKSLYDKYGFNAMGLDSQGFDINGKDVMGVDQSLFGTEEYDKDKDKRKLMLNRLSKAKSIDKINLKKLRPYLNTNHDLEVLNAYRKALQTPNPEKTFNDELRGIFISDTYGKVHPDKMMIKRTLKKFPIRDAKTLTNDEMFAGSILNELKKHLASTFRPNGLGGLATLKTDLKTNSMTNTKKMVITLSLAKGLTTVQKQRCIRNIMYAVNRVRLTMPESKDVMKVSSGDNNVTIRIPITYETFSHDPNNDLLVNMEDEFNFNNRRGIYDPESTKEHSKKYDYHPLSYAGPHKEEPKGEPDFFIGNTPKNKKPPSRKWDPDDMDAMRDVIEPYSEDGKSGFLI